VQQVRNEHLDQGSMLQLVEKASSIHMSAVNYLGSCQRCGGSELLEVTLKMNTRRQRKTASVWSKLLTIVWQRHNSATLTFWKIRVLL